MNCVLEFPKATVTVDYCEQKDKQKMIIDILIKYGEIDIYQLASVLEITEVKIKNICQGDDFLAEEQMDNLSHLFLIFLGSLLQNCKNIDRMAVILIF